MLTVEERAATLGLTQPPSRPAAQVAPAIPLLLGGRHIPISDYAGLKRACEVDLLPNDALVVNGGALLDGENIVPKALPRGSRWAIRSARWDEIQRGIAPAAAQGPAALEAYLLACRPMMGQLRAPGPNGVLYCNDRVHGCSLQGMEVLPHPDSTARNINLLAYGNGPGEWGNHDEADPSAVATDHAIEGSILRGSPSQHVRRAIMANGAGLALRGVLIDEIHEGGFDSQGICGWNGPGPVLLEDVVIYASSQGYMWGGSTAQAAWANPADVTIRRAFFGKRASWNSAAPEYAGYQWVIKPGVELKNMARLSMEDVLIDNAFGWPALTFDCFADTPWARITDILCDNVRVRGSSGFFQSWHAGGTVARIALLNCLATDLYDPSTRWGFQANAYTKGSAFTLAGGEIADLWVEGCTILSTQGTVLQGVKLPRWTLRDNILGFGGGGIAIEGYPAGLPATGAWAVPFNGDVLGAAAWDAYCPDRDWRNNVWLNVQPEDMTQRPNEKPWNARRYWSLAFATDDEHHGGGVDLATGALATDSPFRTGALDGGPLGYREPSAPADDTEARLTALEAWQGQALARWTALTARVTALED